MLGPRKKRYKNIFKLRYRRDPNEWDNLASKEKYAEAITGLRKFAPGTFPEPESSLNLRKDLVIEGEGNYTPPPSYLPYTSLD